MLFLVSGMSTSSTLVDGVKELREAWRDSEESRVRRAAFLLSIFVSLTFTRLGRFGVLCETAFYMWILVLLLCGLPPSLSVRAFLEDATSSSSITDETPLNPDSALAKYLNLRNAAAYVTSSQNTQTCRNFAEHQPVLKLLSSRGYWTKALKEQLIMASFHASLIGEHFYQLGQQQVGEVTTLLDVLRETEPIYEGVGLCEFSNSKSIANVLHSPLKEEAHKAQLKVLCQQARDQLQFSTAVPREWEVDLPFAWLDATCTTPEATPPAVLLRLFFQFKDVYVFFEFNVRNVALDQCYLDLHLCHSSTKCYFRRNSSESKFELGNYKCICQKNYHHQKLGTAEGINGDEVENKYLVQLAAGDFMKVVSELTVLKPDQIAVLLARDVEQEEAEWRANISCQECAPGCRSCNSTFGCRVNYEHIPIRAIPMAIQLLCIAACLVLAVLVCKKRKNRVLKCSNWIMVEIFLLGAVLLYAQSAIKYLPPNTLTCLFLPWFRQLGFPTLYGTLLVKVYRVLCGFQSRKAHRVHVGERDMLRLLASFIVVVLMYAVACSAANLDHVYGPRNSSLMEESASARVGGDGSPYVVCRVMYSEGLTELLELLLAVLGIYYCRCVWAAPSEYFENRFITIIFVNELFFSALSRIARHSIYYRLHPNFIYLIQFFHCHLTVTVAVTLFIGPKLWFVYRPPAAGRGRLMPNKMGLPPNGDLDIGDVNLADMDPEDIRRELRKLYNNIEAYRAKISKKPNPQLSVSKRKGGRKQRRFSLQPFSHKKHQLPTASGIHEEEVSKMSEDSGEDEVTITGPSRVA